mmetsp:Transcript_42223/g.131362  ORF Transcript_42223/g.131362 Transcript_42223/m.131362 type:complete len:259 (-) Transcript_42223:185-961(-)
MHDLGERGQLGPQEPLHRVPGQLAGALARAWKTASRLCRMAVPSPQLHEDAAVRALGVQHHAAIDDLKVAQCRGHHGRPAAADVLPEALVPRRPGEVGRSELHCEVPRERPRVIAHAGRHLLEAGVGDGDVARPVRMGRARRLDPGVEAPGKLARELPSVGNVLNDLRHHLGFQHQQLGAAHGLQRAHVRPLGPQRGLADPVPRGHGVLRVALDHGGVRLLRVPELALDDVVGLRGGAPGGKDDVVLEVHYDFDGIVA